MQVSKTLMQKLISDENAPDIPPETPRPAPVRIRRRLNTVGGAGLSFGGRTEAEGTRRRAMTSSRGGEVRGKKCKKSSENFSQRLISDFLAPTRKDSRALIVGT